jgi:ABC-type transport system substrate-binding protein
VKAAAKELFQDQKFNFEGPNFPTNGPYQVATGGFVQNDRIELQPMKYYRTLGCGARLAKPIFVFYSDKPGLIAAAASRNTDLTQNYTPADLKELTSHSGQFKTSPTPAFEVEHLTLNNDATVSGQKNPLHDARVRVALALALNKMNLIQSALTVSKSVAKQLIAWSPLIITPRLTQPYADKNINGQWDPLQKKYIANTGTGKALADAKKLLAQAGYPNGFTVQGLTTSGNPTRVAEFASMAHDWTKIGVKFVPNYIPASKLFANSWDAGNPVRLGTYQIAMWTDVASPDPNYYINVFQSKYIDREKTVHSPVNSNVGGIKNKLIDEAFNKGATTLNKKERAHWYQIWQEQTNKNAYWITLYYRTDISTTDGKLGNYKANGTGEGFSWNAFEWYDKGLK